MLEGLGFCCAVGAAGAGQRGAGGAACCCLRGYLRPPGGPAAIDWHMSKTCQRRSARHSRTHRVETRHYTIGKPGCMVVVHHSLCHGVEAPGTVQVLF